MGPIVIVNFSGRETGNCAAIAREIQGFHGGAAEYFSFAEKEVHPCGNCRMECFAKRTACPYIDDGIYELYDMISNSGLCYFVVPNYCNYPCSNFFLFNERSQCYFQGRGDLLTTYLAVKKKFIVVSNTGKDHFISAFCQHAEEPDALFLSAKAYHKKSIQGDMMDSPRARADLAVYLEQQ